MVREVSTFNTSTGSKCKGGISSPFDKFSSSSLRMLLRMTSAKSIYSSSSHVGSNVFGIQLDTANLPSSLHPGSSLLSLTFVISGLPHSRSYVLSALDIPSLDQSAWPHHTKTMGSLEPVLVLVMSLANK